MRKNFNIRITSQYIQHVSICANCVNFEGLRSIYFATAKFWLLNWLQQNYNFFCWKALAIWILLGLLKLSGVCIHLYVCGYKQQDLFKFSSVGSEATPLTKMFLWNVLLKVTIVSEHTSSSAVYTCGLWICSAGGWVSQCRSLPLFTVRVP